MQTERVPRYLNAIKPLCLEEQERPLQELSAQLVAYINLAQVIIPVDKWVIFVVEFINGGIRRFRESIIEIETGNSCYPTNS